jgi:hypothetical protein
MHSSLLLLSHAVGLESRYYYVYKRPITNKKVQNMELSNSSKVTVLLHLLEQQTKSIDDRVKIERSWFEWTTGLLLASFGAVVALSGRTQPLPYPEIIKTIATILVVVPAIISISRILRTTQGMMNNATAVERIQDLLFIFEDDIYGKQSPFPVTWRGKLASGFLKRRTPKYYSLILLIMTTCVVATV